MTWKGTVWSAVSWLESMRGTCGGRKVQGHVNRRGGEEVDEIWGQRLVACLSMEHITTAFDNQVNTGNLGSLSRVGGATVLMGNEHADAPAHDWAIFRLIKWANQQNKGLP